jgi:hypothetical protein
MQWYLIRKQISEKLCVWDNFIFIFRVVWSVIKGIILLERVILLADK